MSGLGKGEEDAKMVIEIIGFTLDVIGKVLLGVSVYLVHSRVVREGKIDRAVLTEMKKEKTIALMGIILIIIGYVMQLPGKLAGGAI